jgi:predicted small lipoprotein YifL
MQKLFLTVILLSIFLTSCGKTGALYLPDEPQEIPAGQEENSIQKK